VEWGLQGEQGVQVSGHEKGHLPGQNKPKKAITAIAMKLRGGEQNFETFKVKSRCLPKLANYWEQKNWSKKKKEKKIFLQFWSLKLQILQITK
jgi:hypothetical protein